jgi:hypothetical protein
MREPIRSLLEASASRNARKSDAGADANADPLTATQRQKNTPENQMQEPMRTILETASDEGTVVLICFKLCLFFFNWLSLWFLGN